MIGRILLASAVALSVLLIGCTELDALQRKEIVGAPGNAGISWAWGGDSACVDARITSVKVETFESVASNPRNNSGGTERIYDVVSTAAAMFSIRNAAMFKLLAPAAGLTAKIRFRLVSAGGVILREHEEDTTFQPSDPAVFCSTRFAGLSKDELGKASRVSASWVYGR